MKDLTFLKSKLIAHRGIYDNKRIYENTLAAFERAIKNNYIIELDLRMLKDGSIVAFHDEDMERLLHLEGDIEKLTYDDLCYVARYQIPKLEEVLEKVNGVVYLLLDLKTVSKRNLFENNLANLLDKYEGKFAIQSENIKTLKWFYKNRNTYPIGYVITKRNSKRQHLFKKYDFINIHINIFNDQKIKQLRSKYMVLGYGVKKQEEVSSKISIYDNLICDNLLEFD